MSILALSASYPHKNYLRDKIPFKNHFQPKAVALGLTKAGILQGLMVGAKMMEQLSLDEEEEDDNKPIEVPTLRQFSVQCIYAYVKTFSVTTTQRVLEFLAIRYFDERIAGKMVKNVTKSAVAKFSRYGSKLKSATLIFKTAYTSNTLYHFAVFLVEEAVLAYRCIRRSLECKSEKKSAPSEDDFVKDSANKVTRLGFAIVAGALGASIGTAISPGRGTTYGALIGDSVAYMVM